jgi:hypothetical protein
MTGGTGVAHLAAAQAHSRLVTRRRWRLAGGRAPSPTRQTANWYSTSPSTPPRTTTPWTHLTSSTMSRDNRPGCLATRPTGVGGPSSPQAPPGGAPAGGLNACARWSISTTSRDRGPGRRHGRRVRRERTREVPTRPVASLGGPLPRFLQDGQRSRPRNALEGALGALVVPPTRRLGAAPALKQGSGIDAATRRRRTGTRGGQPGRA